jgi:fructose-specific phosphotransferase system IIC component
MAGKTLVKTVLISAISAGIGYLIYTRAGLTAGIVSTFMASWILFQFRSVQNAWENLGNFQNPVLFSINSFFAAYIYLSWNQTPQKFYLSFAAFLLGGALSLLIYKYWNIGG